MASAPTGHIGTALPPGAAVLEYTVERTLGGGGFGITYLARDVNLNLAVALKEYLPTDLAQRTGGGAVQPLADSTAEQFRWGLERFLDEARALATFRHPNIARVLRYFTANGTAYIVMEYETGQPLKAWLPPHAPLNREALLRIVLPLLDGLERVHAAGFLHRDIKPDNIYMRADGSPVLIDFGAARSLGSDRELTTIVSPGYAPFEQYHSRGHQGPWSDLYSLAAVMYWMVSGTKPLEAAARLKNDALVPALQCGRADLVGEAVLRAIDWALDPEETRRPQTVAEFRERLAPGSGATARVTGSPQAPADPSVASASRSGASGASGMSGRSAAPSHAPSGNMVCSVLFLDIVGYSKVSVKDQYEIKSQFNQLIAGKLAHIPDDTRITLDTGDGAAICFMGDPEQVLHTAVDIRRSLSEQERLRVRIGLHMGPVRILNDLNGRVNVIGDGINAAQRVMSFADENALLVSRAFYDVVSCLSDGAERDFRHRGAQADKHGRLHELYEVVPRDEEGAIGNRTIRLDDGADASAAMDDNAAAAEIDPVELAAIERDLARHLGPLAPVLMRKARGRAHSPAEMRELLARGIADPAAREAFRTGASDITRSGGRSAAMAPPRSEVSVAGARSDSRAVAGPGAPSTAPSSAFAPSRSFAPSQSQSPSQSSASLRPWLSAEQAAQLEKLLVQTVGPVARVLVKNEARKADSYAALCQALALHLEDAGARARFLKDAARPS